MRASLCPLPGHKKSSNQNHLRKQLERMGNVPCGMWLREALRTQRAKFKKAQQNSRFSRILRNSYFYKIKKHYLYHISGSIGYRVQYQIPVCKSPFSLFLEIQKGTLKLWTSAMHQLICKSNFIENAEWGDRYMFSCQVILTSDRYHVIILLVCCNQI